MNIQGAVHADVGIQEICNEPVIASQLHRGDLAGAVHVMPGRASYDPVRLCPLLGWPAGQEIDRLCFNLEGRREASHSKRGELSLHAAIAAGLVLHPNL